MTSESSSSSETAPQSRLEQVKEMPRSVSQLKTMRDCAYRYKLERVDQLHQRPAAWFPMGTAVHEATAKWNESGRKASYKEADEWFLEAYVREIDLLCEKTPNLDWWFASGPYKGPADIERRLKLGRNHVVNYMNYYQIHEAEVIWVSPDGVPGIEFRFDAVFGGVKILGYIDTVLNEVVEDTKTGNSPDPALQVAVYARSLEQMYPDQEWSAGRYFMTKHGKPTELYELDMYTEDVLGSLFKEADDKIKAEEFTPNPGDACARCSVSWACEFAVPPKF